MTTSLSSFNSPDSSATEANMTRDKLQAMTPAVGTNGVEVFSFQEYYPSPIGSFGLISLKESYKKSFTQPNGTDVGVNITIMGVTRIDSIEKIVGIKIFLTLEWEDNRIVWGLGGPKNNTEWEFDPKVLKFVE